MLSRAELAMSIGVGTGSIDQMVAEGALPLPRKWHSRKLWLVSEVEAHLNEWPSDGTGDGWDDYGRPSNAIDRALAATEATTERARQRAPNPLSEWHAKLGFDPATMDAADLKRLIKEAGERRVASIPGTPMGVREREALRQLAAAGVGVPIPRHTVKGCGTDTEERLKARGYLDTRPNPKFPDRVGSYVLTEAGMSAWIEIGGPAAG